MVQSPWEVDFEYVQAPFLHRIFAFYRGKLDRIFEDPSTGPVVRNDIILIREKISEAEEQMKVSRVYTDDFMARFKALVCQALNAYVASLKESRKEFYAKLGAEPEMHNLQNEIDHAQNFMAKYCS